MSKTLRKYQAEVPMLPHSVLMSGLKPCEKLRWSFKEFEEKIEMLDFDGFLTDFWQGFCLGALTIIVIWAVASLWF